MAPPWNKITVPPKEVLEYMYYTEGHSYSYIAKFFETVPSTISRWFKAYGLKARISADAVKMIRGELHKQCHGPHHNGAWVPVSNFWKDSRKKSGVRFRCLDCTTIRKNISFTTNYQMWLESIVRRIGSFEAARRLEVHSCTITEWRGLSSLRPRPKKIWIENAKRIVKLAAELRETGEVRHKHSIRHGAYLRGRTERKVVAQRDLYVPTGDNSNEYKRQYRKNNPEIVAAHEQRNKIRRRVTKETAETSELTASEVA